MCDYDEADIWVWCGWFADSLFFHFTFLLYISICLHSRWHIFCFTLQRFWSIYSVRNWTKGVAEKEWRAKEQETNNYMGNAPTKHTPRTIFFALSEFCRQTARTQYDFSLWQHNFFIRVYAIIEMRDAFDNYGYMANKIPRRGSQYIEYGGVPCKNINQIDIELVGIYIQP